jgi:hypothetical protein
MNVKSSIFQISEKPEAGSWKLETGKTILQLSQVSGF